MRGKISSIVEGSSVVFFTKILDHLIALSSDKKILNRQGIKAKIEESKDTTNSIYVEEDGMYMRYNVVSEEGQFKSMF